MAEKVRVKVYKVDRYLYEKVISIKFYSEETYCYIKTAGPHDFILMLEEKEFSLPNHLIYLGSYSRRPKSIVGKVCFSGEMELAKKSKDDSYHSFGSDDPLRGITGIDTVTSHPLCQFLINKNYDWYTTVRKFVKETLLC